MQFLEKLWQTSNVFGGDDDEKVYYYIIMLIVFAGVLTVAVGYFIIALAFFINVYISPHGDPQAVLL